MGAIFLGVTLVGSIAWFAWHRHEYSPAHAGVRILIFAFVGAIFGKLVEVGGYHLRGRTLRDMVNAIARRSLLAAHSK
jgi:hypothetical protein